MFPLVGGTSRVSRYKREYLYIHEYFTIKFLYHDQWNNHDLMYSSDIQVNYKLHPWQGLVGTLLNSFAKSWYTLLFIF